MLSVADPETHTHYWILCSKLRTTRMPVCDYKTNNKTSSRQECIPVGCVPAARRPCSGVSFPGGGVCQVRVVCLVRGVGGGSARSGGGCLPGGGSAWSGGMCLPGPGGVCQVRGGVCQVQGGFCLVLGGVCLLGGGLGISQHALRQTPSPPVDRILDTRLWKYYLGPTSLRPVMTTLFNVCNHYFCLTHAITSRRQRPQLVYRITNDFRCWQEDGEGVVMYFCLEWPNSSNKRILLLHLSPSPTPSKEVLMTLMSSE